MIIRHTHKLRGVIVAIFLMAPLSVFALPIVNTGACVDGVDTCYTSIENLEVNGLLYDVDWYSSEVSFSDILISDPNVASFANDWQLAFEAANAINAVFNDDGNSHWTIDYGSVGFVGVWVVSGYTGSEVEYYSASSRLDRVNGRFTDPVSQMGPYGIFTQVQETVPTVPEPSSIALLGLGFAGFGLARRKRKV